MVLSDLGFALWGRRLEAACPAAWKAALPGLERRHPAGWTSGFQPLEPWNQNRGQTQRQSVQTYFREVVEDVADGVVGPWVCFVGEAAGSRLSSRLEGGAPGFGAPASCRLDERLPAARTVESEPRPDPAPIGADLLSRGCRGCSGWCCRTLGLLCGGGGWKPPVQPPGRRRSRVWSAGILPAGRAASSRSNRGIRTEARPSANRCRPAFARLSRMSRMVLSYLGLA